MTRILTKRLPKRLALVVWINGNKILEMSSGIGKNKHHLAFSKYVIEYLLEEMRACEILTANDGYAVRLEIMSFDTTERKVWDE